MHLFQKLYIHIYIIFIPKSLLSYQAKYEKIIVQKLIEQMSELFCSSRKISLQYDTNEIEWVEVADSRVYSMGRALTAF